MSATSQDDSGRLAAIERVRAWVEREVSDWYDPVIDPDLHDALRIVVGLPPEDREEE